MEVLPFFFSVQLFSVTIVHISALPILDLYYPLKRFQLPLPALKHPRRAQ